MNAIIGIAGSYKVNQTIKVTNSNFAKGTTFTYKWLLDGKVLGTATSYQLKITSAMKGHKLSVLWTATAKGFDPISNTSTPTSVTG